MGVGNSIFAGKRTAPDMFTCPTNANIKTKNEKLVSGQENWFLHLFATLLKFYNVSCEPVNNWLNL